MGFSRQAPVPSPSSSISTSVPLLPSPQAWLNRQTESWLHSFIHTLFFTSTLCRPTRQTPAPVPLEFIALLEKQTNMTATQNDPSFGRGNTGSGSTVEHLAGTGEGMFREDFLEEVAAHPEWEAGILKGSLGHRMGHLSDPPEPGWVEATPYGQQGGCQPLRPASSGTTHTITSMRREMRRARLSL